MRNYIADLNRFKLAGPPIWWLRQLHEFDPDLVVVPSRQICCYRLAIRRPLNLPMHVVNDLLFEESDTRMLASYGLVPVTTITADANWSNPLMWKELHDRAPWRNGGYEKVMRHIEATERAVELKRAKELDEKLGWYAKEAWQFYRYKAGLQSNAFSLHTSESPTPPKKAPLIKLAPKYAPVRPDIMTSFER